MNPTSIPTLALLLALTACGGGGGSSAPEPVAPPPLTVQQLQGYWTGPATGTALGTATKVRAVVRDDGAAWLFLHDGSQPAEPLLGLATATLTPTADTFRGSGRRYPASGTVVADLAVSGSAPVTRTVTVDVASAGNNGRLALTYDAAYETPATTADAAAAWRFTKAAGTIEATWTVGATGALTGISTLGCTYAGTMLPHSATTAIYDVTVTETCATSVKRLAGIGRLNAAKTFMTFGLTTSDGTEAEAFAAQRTPT